MAASITAEPLPKKVRVEELSSAKAKQAKKLYVLMDSSAWFLPLRTALQNEEVLFEEWSLVDKSIDLMGEPPQGVFLCKVSASCHTRGHREAAEYGRQVVLWLLSHGRRVINGGCPPGSAIDFELSKVKQATCLRLAALDTPESVAVPVAMLIWRSGHCEYAFPASEPQCSPAEALRTSLLRLLNAVETFEGPMVLKPNCGGRGLGVKKFAECTECAYILREVVEGSAPVPDWLQEGWPIDGVYVVQRNIIPRDPSVTRVEIVGGKLAYAQRTDTSDGVVNLCTADGCVRKTSTASRFSWRKDITEDSLIVQQCIAFAAKHGLDIAGFEFIEELKTEKKYIYDINPNTNYSASVIQAAGKDPNRMVVELCKSELDRV